jgi:CubicO group peptidase (beta-lactamase class C family)
VEHREQPEYAFKIALITKQFIAPAILLLEERGRLKIDTS